MPQDRRRSGANQMASGAPPPATGWVAGVDGCRGGWFVVLSRMDGRAVRHRRVDGFEALLTLPEAPRVVGIDVIIGLPDAPRQGGRACDRRARQLLGGARSSSVFSPPAYAVLDCATYAEALAVNRAHSPDGVGLSKQTFHLLPKLRAVAEHMTPARQKYMREVHPELAFFAMNGARPLAHSKHKAAGRHERITLLRAQGFDSVRAAIDEYAGADVGADDMLDAYAVCWSAQRMAQGTAVRLPAPAPPRNARGLCMEIWR